MYLYLRSVDCRQGDEILNENKLNWMYNITDYFCGQGKASGPVCVCLSVSDQ